VVGENGTEVRVDEGSLDEVADTTAEDRDQALVRGPRVGRQ
jgi:hypothetical protein